MIEDELDMKIAQLETWHFLEKDPETKERVAAELARYIKDADTVRAEKEVNAEKTAQTEKKKDQQAAEEKAETQAKEVVAVEPSGLEEGMFERAESDRGQSGRSGEHYERMLEIPEYIRNSPMYKAGVIAHRAAQAEKAIAHNQGLANQGGMEATEAKQHLATPSVEENNYSSYEQAAKALDATPIKQGQEIEGEVVEIAQVDGNNYYLIEQDGERLAVPAGEKPEYEKGDEISVSRNKEGFETVEAYGYGR